jgi:CubicO group peptidase (beta-lactamase class C family)
VAIWWRGAENMFFMQIWAARWAGMAIGRRDLLGTIGLLPALIGRASAQGVTSETTLRAFLTVQLATGKASRGYVAALRGSDGVARVAVGSADAGDARPLDGRSIFEIGSITKVFTALLLADMVRSGEVAYSDPVAKFLPPEGRPLMFDEQPITLIDLVTYTSGLPRLPDNLDPSDLVNPYAKYGVAQLYAFLSGTSPLYYPGAQYEYANLGFGLLGHALALRAGRSYEELIVARICAKLGLDDTRITLSPEQRGRLVQGHDAALRPTPNWDFLSLAGAGALRSTADDMMRFLDCCQGRIASELAPAFADLLAVRRQTDMRGVYAASGWFVDNTRDDELVNKSGGTGGYASFIGYSTRSGRACVLLANAAAAWDSTPILGLHILNDHYLKPVWRRVVALDPARLAELAGRYPLTPGFVLTVTVEDGRLMVQATGQAAYEVFPESDVAFFYRVVDAQLTFERGPDGVARALVLHQNGRNRRAMKER